MLFIDTASIDEIKKWSFLVEGVTTNPKIIMNTAPNDVRKLYREDPIEGVKLLLGKIGDVIGDVPVSVEIVTENEFEEALAYHEMGAVVKVPVLPEKIQLIRELAREGVMVNATVIMSASQAYLAALAGAVYVSIFFNRIKDVGGNPCDVIAKARRLLETSDLEGDTVIIAGSIRNPYDVIDATICGAHIVTVPPKIFPKMLSHPKTIETVREFERAWRSE